MRDSIYCFEWLLRFVKKDRRVKAQKKIKMQEKKIIYGYYVISARVSESLKCKTGEASCR
jgi:hypothetical protein